MIVYYPTITKVYTSNKVELIDKYRYYDEFIEDLDDYLNHYRNFKFLEEEFIKGSTTVHKSLSNIVKDDIGLDRKNYKRVYLLYINNIYMDIYKVHELIKQKVLLYPLLKFFKQYPQYIEEYLDDYETITQIMFSSVLSLKYKKTLESTYYRFIDKRLYQGLLYYFTKCSHKDEELYSFECLPDHYADTYLYPDPLRILLYQEATKSKGMVNGIDSLLNQDQSYSLPILPRY